MANVDTALVPVEGVVPPPLDLMDDPFAPSEDEGNDVPPAPTRPAPLPAPSARQEKKELRERVLARLRTNPQLRIDPTQTRLPDLTSYSVPELYAILANFDEQERGRFHGMGVAVCHGVGTVIDWVYPPAQGAGTYLAQDEATVTAISNYLPFDWFSELADPFTIASGLVRAVDRAARENNERAARRQRINEEGAYIERPAQPAPAQEAPSREQHSA